MDMTPDMPVPQDTWVALTDYELREVTMHMPGRQTVPVTTRGFDADQVLVVEGSAPGGLHALAALARLREAVTGPTVQEPQSDAQEAVQPPGGHPSDARLSRLADDMQVVVEQALSAMEVDQGKYDVQNRAGDVVAGLLAVLRRYAFLLGADAEEVLNGPSGARSLRQAARDGYLSQRDEVQSAIWRGLTGPGSAREPIQRVMDELDGVFR